MYGTQQLRLCVVQPQEWGEAGRRIVESQLYCPFTNFVFHEMPWYGGLLGRLMPILFVMAPKDTVEANLYNQNV
jgi:hypothetical protein